MGYRLLLLLSRQGFYLCNEVKHSVVPYHLSHGSNKFDMNLNLYETLLLKPVLQDGRAGMLSDAVARWLHANPSDHVTS